MRGEKTTIETNISNIIARCLLRQSGSTHLLTSDTLALRFSPCVRDSMSSHQRYTSTFVRRRITIALGRSRLETARAPARPYLSYSCPTHRKRRTNGWRSSFTKNDSKDFKLEYETAQRSKPRSKSHTAIPLDCGNVSYGRGQIKKFHAQGV